MDGEGDDESERGHHAGETAAVVPQPKADAMSVPT
jgi:hypothetical protein